MTVIDPARRALRCCYCGRTRPGRRVWIGRGGYRCCYAGVRIAYDVRAVRLPDAERAALLAAAGVRLRGRAALAAVKAAQAAADSNPAPAPAGVPPAAGPAVDPTPWRRDGESRLKAPKRAGWNVDAGIVVDGVRLTRAERDAEIRRLLAAGESVRRVAARMRCGLATVQRAREGG